MNEFDLVSLLTRSLPTNKSMVLGAGDDCAMLDVGLPDRLLLLKTDAVVEGIHFLPETPPEKIGHKAMARCLSDIAAMAGTPTAALVTLGLPKEFDAGVIEKIYAGMSALARKHDVAIAGGETTTNPGGMLISVSLVGHVQRGKATLRSGAEAGDALFVTGELGGSISGRHLEFEPRMAEARWLARHFSVHAMLDLSDGLAGDLRHLLRASRLGAELLASSIPVSRAAKDAARRAREGGGRGLSERAAGKPPLLAALTDGEDYELLFTVAAKEAVPLMDAWKKEFPGLRLTCIGKITSSEGVHIRDKDGSALCWLMVTNISHNSGETEALGESWGRDARAGLVIGLSGDLGAGKTQLVKGLARGLGFSGRVHSPSFTLVNIYEGGRITLFHLDLYRLETREQILAAGLEEYFHPSGVAVIEWAERWFGELQGGNSQGRNLPQQLRWVQFEALAENERRITYEDFGA